LRCESEEQKKEHNKGESKETHGTPFEERDQLGRSTSCKIEFSRLMTSGGDTNISLTKPCKPSAKNHHENANSQLHNKPLKNKSLTETALAFWHNIKFISMQFSAIFALFISYRMLRARFIASQEAGSSSSFRHVDLLGHAFGPRLDLLESLLAGIFLQTGQRGKACALVAPK
jgi:hypothetical protein